MHRLLLALLLIAPAVLTAQDNPNYDPDYDGDGCYSVNDILGLLPLFGSCAPFSCGDSLLYDNYWYETVLIGDQCWFAENLRTTQYANGNLIPAGLTDNEWVSTTTGATSVFGEGENECSSFSPDIDACDVTQSLAEYGRLYNWYAVSEEGGLCPSGWHVPSDGEWTDLANHITIQQGIPYNVAEGLKSTTGWANDGNGTDEFGFSALPGGLRTGFPDFGESAGGDGNWWSSSPQLNIASGEFSYWYRFMSSENWLGRTLMPAAIVGLSVRCLRDAE